MRKVLALITVSAMAAALMAGCGSSAASSSEAPASSAASSEAASSEAASSEVGMANPWVDTDAAGVMQATGLELLEPENGENFHYSVLTSEQMAQMTYTLKETGDEVTVRAQATGDAEDISGLAQAPSCIDVEMDGVTYNVGSFTTTDGKQAQLCTWFDAVPGISYSAMVTSDGDLNGFDITGVAAQVYVPTQEAVDPDGSELSGLYDDLPGMYYTKDESITMIIDYAEGVDISITRLSEFTGTLTNREGSIATITAVDPNGKDMTLELNVDAFTLTVTDSSWDLLTNGESFTFDYVQGL